MGEEKVAFPRTGRSERMYETEKDYWQNQYDLHKHLSTISVAATVGVGAIVGGISRAAKRRHPRAPKRFISRAGGEQQGQGLCRTSTLA